MRKVMGHTMAIQTSSVTRITTEVRSSDYLYFAFDINSFKPGVPFMGHRQTE